MSRLSSSRIFDSSTRPVHPCRGRALRRKRYSLNVFLTLLFAFLSMFDDLVGFCLVGGGKFALPYPARLCRERDDNDNVIAIFGVLYSSLRLATI